MSELDVIAGFKVAIMRAKEAEANDQSVPWFPYNRIEELMNAYDERLTAKNKTISELMKDQREIVQQNGELMMSNHAALTLISEMRAQWVHSWAAEKCMAILKKHGIEHPPLPEKKP